MSAPKEDVTEKTVDKEKEALINARIEKIRKQNEEIQRRHKEVEQDKLKADEVSALAPTSETRPIISRQKGQPTQKSNTPRPRNRSPTAAKKMERIPRTSPSNKIYSNFAEGDGPPPDPSNWFLADDERDEPRAKPETFPTSGQGSGQSTKRSSGPYNKEKSTNFKGRGRRQEHRRKGPQDEAWREERAAIDEARITRQKTAEGSWKREWDNQKVSNEPDYDERPMNRRKEQMKFQNFITGGFHGNEAGSPESDISQKSKEVYSCKNPQNIQITKTNSGGSDVFPGALRKPFSLTKQTVNPVSPEVTSNWESTTIISPSARHVMRQGDSFSISVPLVEKKAANTKALAGSGRTLSPSQSFQSHSSRAECDALVKNKFSAAQTKKEDIDLHQLEAELEKIHVTTMLQGPRAVSLSTKPNPPRSPGKDIKNQEEISTADIKKDSKEDSTENEDHLNLSGKHCSDAITSTKPLLSISGASKLCSELEKGEDCNSATEGEEWEDVSDEEDNI